VSFISARIRNEILARSARFDKGEREARATRTTTGSSEAREAREARSIERLCKVYSCVGVCSAVI